MKRSISIQQHTRGPHLHTLYNVRDLGGYATVTGQTTQSGRFLRADAPVRLDEHDRSILLAYPVRTVIDLRSDSELKAAPSHFAQDTSVNYHHVSLMGDDIGKAMAALAEYAYQNANNRAAQVGPADFYIMLLDRSQEAIGQVMNLLADAPPGTSLFNCSHGKDRTGVIAALLLLLAGVPEDAVVENYQVSDILLQPWFDTFIHEIPKKDLVFYNTNPRHMRQTLDHLALHYGSTDHFLDRCGVSDRQQARLKTRLLEP